MAGRTHYEVLGVPQDASADDIKKAYRRMARRTHPDVNTEPGAEEAFKAVGEAYYVLSDSGRREDYDLTLRKGTSPDPQPAADTTSTTAAGGAHEPPTADSAHPSFTSPTSSKRRPRRRPAHGNLDARLAALGWGSLLKTFAAVTAAVAVGLLARVTGLAGLVLGVHPGQLIATGRYEPLPSLPFDDTTATRVFVAFIGFGVLIGLTNSWQRRVLLGRVRRFEAPLLAGMLATVAACGELLVDRPVVLAALTVLTCVYAAYLWVVAGRVRLPRLRPFRAR